MFPRRFFIVTIIVISVRRFVPFPVCGSCVEGFIVPGPATNHMRGLLNNEDIESHISPTFPRPLIPKVGSKKFVQQGRQLLGASRRGPPLFCARSVWIIREHRKMARTPLTAFFNRPMSRLTPFGRGRPSPNLSIRQSRFTLPLSHSNLMQAAALTVFSTVLMAALMAFSTAMTPKPSIVNSTINVVFL